MYVIIYPCTEAINATETPPKFVNILSLRHYGFFKAVFVSKAALYQSILGLGASNLTPKEGPIDTVLLGEI